MTTITVTADDLAGARLEGSVLVLPGTDDQGRQVVFAGDWRMMDVFIQAVEDQGEALAEVEPWQIIGGAL